MALSISIFLFTMALVILQPRGLQIGTSAVIGALLAYVLGAVDFGDMLEVGSIVWDATLSFIGIIILSMVLDEIGFFEWCALKMAKLSKGNGHKMFIYSVLLGAAVSALFANDGAALILTPILLSKMRLLKLDAKTIVAFLLAGGFISDSASLPFIFSNLTNIVTAGYFDIGFADYSKNMASPFIVSVFVSTIVLWAVLRRDIPKTVDISLLKDADSVLKDKPLFYFSWLFLAIASQRKAAKFYLTIKTAPWQIVWFSIGLYIVVYGLKNAGLTDKISIVVGDMVKLSEPIAIIGVGFLSAILSAFMNNMPTVMVMDIALRPYANDMLAYANIIGCNLGPKMTPFGSLATLLWLHVLDKKGVKIGFLEYSKFGLLVTPIVLFVVLVGLAV